MKFTRVDQRPSFPALEAEVLARWKSEKTFEASVEKNKAAGEEFIFYDGPPFPTGNPHHGTIFVSILKDIIPRYKTMRGYYVPRGWGWDCHGLPIETLAEKNLGIKEKTEIETSLGVKAFNAECRRIVSEFNESWKIYIDKLGRWVDFDEPYQTLDRDFMESVIWSFAESYKKDLIYKDYRVNPYCYRCETPLSISDTRLDDATRPRQDPSVSVRLAVKGEKNLYLTIWTTTPWTLPSNLAVAVGEEITYVTVEKDGDKYIFAKDLLPKFKKEFGNKPEVLEEFSGADLVARDYRYEPIFPYFKDQNPNGFKVLIGEFVTTDEGTGIVHMAPAFGEDDYWLCRKYDISVISPVDEKGRFTDEVTDFAGQNVHDVNREIIKYLKAQGDVIQDNSIEHNYPHCWRCRTPLIYKALDAWYFSIEKIKDKLIANNQEVAWYPETVKDGRFGNWLENARDWNISRNRYWATPIPVWDCSDSECGNRDVLGSLEEIEAKAGKELPDIHKEFLDEVTYDCSKCSGTMTRVPEVLDGWYESGSMPYGQYHYPFKNADHFRSHFPCDFIVEYTGQIRGWFYYLHVLSTALFDKPAFKNCLVHGTLLAEDGKKISKSLKNYTDPMELMDTYGADALRLIYYQLMLFKWLILLLEMMVLKGWLKIYHFHFGMHFHFSLLTLKPMILVKMILNLKILKMTLQSLIGIFFQNRKFF
ncbi:MAG: isoleucine--tRNA ligase [Bdellovibrionota bacterium]